MDKFLYTFKSWRLTNSLFQAHNYFTQESFGTILSMGKKSRFCSYLKDEQRNPKLSELESIRRVCLWQTLTNARKDTGKIVHSPIFYARLPKATGCNK